MNHLSVCDITEDKQQITRKQILFGAQLYDSFLMSLLGQTHL